MNQKTSNPKKPVLPIRKYPHGYLQSLIDKSPSYLDIFEAMYPKKYPDTNFNLLPESVQKFIKLLIGLYFAGKQGSPLTRYQLSLTSGYTVRNRFMVILALIEQSLLDSSWILVRQKDGKEAIYHIRKRMKIQAKITNEKT